MVAAYTRTPMAQTFTSRSGSVHLHAPVASRATNLAPKNPVGLALESSKMLTSRTSRFRSENTRTVAAKVGPE